MNLKNVSLQNVDIAMDIINKAKTHLKEQGIDQWQSGYPDYACIQGDVEKEKGFFIMEEEQILGYLCIDYEGEPAYDTLQGAWSSVEAYVVVHRMAFHPDARGKNLSGMVFQLVEEMSTKRNIHNFRVDTDADNTKMQHVLKKNGFSYCGTIWFDNSEKIAFDKRF